MASVKAGIYKEIGRRTGGDVYLGVVGPVRTGKSTFIKKFMERAVIPNIESEEARARAVDETPQSAAGRTVMTTEPKFVPEEAVCLTFSDNSEIRVRAVDCVGFLVPGALGDTEEGEVRTVLTPWSDTPIPFEEAAEQGTRKVIRDHSTVGILVTTDGTFGDLPRSAYEDAERRVAEELKSCGKPFAIVLNSAEPGTAEAEELALSLEEKYGVPVALLNCLDLDEGDAEELLKLVLAEFPLREIKISFPEWCGALDRTHWLRAAISDGIVKSVDGPPRTADAAAFAARIAENVASRCGAFSDRSDGVGAEVTRLDMGEGVVQIAVCLPDGMFYDVIAELTGIDVGNEEDLLSALRSLAATKREYDKFAAAIDDVTEKGYGIVMPDQDDLTLDEPQIVRQAGGYGLRLRAAAPSIHLIKAPIETELNPIVGTEEQSEELVKFLLSEFEDDKRAIWDTDLFGKSIYELVNEGLHSKLENLPDDARDKFGQTISRVINEGSKGLICIIL